MIVNADKFQAIILNKKESEAKYKLTIDNNDIESPKSVKLLCMTIDDRLRFESTMIAYISNLRSKAAMQLNALGRLQKYMGKPEKVAIVNSFIYANFSYCPFVWHFSTRESIRKIEKIQKRCLRIVLDDYDSDYDALLRKSGKVTIEIKRLRVLAIEIFKTVNNLNPNYMKDIFTPKLHPKVRPNDILVKHHNTITYGTKSLKTLGPKIWSQLPEDIKSETSYTKFKEHIDTWKLSFHQRFVGSPENRGCQLR